MRGVCLVCVLFFCGTLLADVVVTRDGAHWKGTAKTTQQTVVLETPFGTLRFPWDAVKELRYEPLRHVFLLVSGQKVRVLLVGETPTAYRVILNGRKTEFARGLVERTEDVTPLVEKAHKDLTSNLKKLSEIAKELDHRVLIPVKYSGVKVRDREVELENNGKRYVFPREDCVLLPVDSTSVENLAEYILQRIIEKMHLEGLEEIEIGVDEGFGQGARFSRVL